LRLSPHIPSIAHKNLAEAARISESKPAGIQERTNLYRRPSANDLRGKEDVTSLDAADGFHGLPWLFPGARQFLQLLTRSTGRFRLTE
jgi:hypothetical protein